MNQLEMFAVSLGGLIALGTMGGFFGAWLAKRDIKKWESEHENRRTRP